MMYMCHFISCHKFITLVWDVDNEEAYAGMGQGMYRKSLYFPFHFVVNLKLLLKGKS